MQNPVPDPVPGQIAQRALAKRGAAYASEVRRLLDAGLAVMRACGTASRPRVSDIVAAAGLSNDAFYRHFPSKDALVAAVLEDGADRLHGYLQHQMEKERAADEKVRRWVEGVLAQAADPEIAATTRAVLWNVGGVGDGLASGHTAMNAPLATLLREPCAALGSSNAELAASFVAYGVIGQLSDYLRRAARPTRVEIDHIVACCLAAAMA